MKKNQIIGIILMVALALLYVPVPFVKGKDIAAVGILICAIYLLVKK